MAKVKAVAILADRPRISRREYLFRFMVLSHSYDGKSAYMSLIG